MSSNNIVLPPANGKKLWRVKRTPSLTNNSNSNNNSTSHNNNHSQTSVECLNNSLKIVAAAQKFTVKRPPLRRPKNKPGKPKDFVFVDLSPIKSDEEVELTINSTTKNNTTEGNKIEKITPIVEQLPSPSLSIEDTLSSIDDSIFDLPTLNGYETTNSNIQPIFSGESQSLPNSNDSSPTLELGLGIMNLGIDWNQPQQTPIQQQFIEIPQAPKQPPTHFDQQQQQIQQQIPQSTDFFSQQLFGYQQAMLQQHLQIQQLQQQLLQQQISIESQITKNNTLTSTPNLNQLQSPFQEPLPTNPITTPITSSTKSKKTAGQFQFKTYQPKPKHQRTISEACIKKPQHNKKLHERSMSLPYNSSNLQLQSQQQSQQLPQPPQQPSQQQQFQPQQHYQEYTSLPMQSSDSSCSEVSLDDFMILNDQISINLNSNETSSETPISEISENDLINLNKSFIIDEFLNQNISLSLQQQQQNQQIQIQQNSISCFTKDDFELGTFVHI
ncbi:uncharacterized protein KGF55_002024 [Candida pseudojiufengensis]|uniref:uncharacterized protein n=1 Tax=Candida pseudojiufengensis TaxID=497109 RepID=UPI0022246257|nr:uncharacterized protein KGF55_002024 [Candida pseudojiufengensis]KAI5964082.1 hypothetical protein KGF55_002024 [Candida pseudojiufengensis]